MSDRRTNRLLKKADKNHQRKKRKINPLLNKLSEVKQ